MLNEEPEGSPKPVRRYDVIVELKQALGDCQAAQGDVDSAIVSYREAVLIAAKHSKDSPYYPLVATKLAKIFETRVNFPLGEAADFRKRADAYYNEKQLNDAKFYYASKYDTTQCDNLKALAEDLKLLGNHGNIRSSRSYKAIGYARRRQ